VGQQIVLDRFQNQPGSLVFKQTERQAADGENLVRMDGGIIHANLVVYDNHGKEAATGVVPEA